MYPLPLEPVVGVVGSESEHEAADLMIFRVVVRSLHYVSRQWLGPTLAPLIPFRFMLLSEAAAVRRSRLEEVGQSEGCW